MDVKVMPGQIKVDCAGNHIKGSCLSEALIIRRRGVPRERLSDPSERTMMLMRLCLISTNQRRKLRPIFGLRAILQTHNAGDRSEAHSRLDNWHAIVCRRRSPNVQLGAIAPLHANLNAVRSSSTVV